MKEQIKNYINTNYAYNTPIFTKEVVEVFPNLKSGTIRQILRRLKEEGLLAQYANGIYFRPKKQGIMNKSFITPQQISEKKYLRDGNIIIGYETGFNLANKLGLSTQTSPISEIRSNAVSLKKRKIKIGNNVFIINAPRVKVTNENYKLLQVLDILTDFNKYSEYRFEEVKQNIYDYMQNIKLTKQDITQIVKSYPLQTQVEFYKFGGLDAAAQT